MVMLNWQLICEAQLPLGLSYTFFSVLKETIILMALCQLSFKLSFLLGTRAERTNGFSKN